MNILKLALSLVVALALTGCIAPQSYVDPAFGKAAYTDITKVDQQYNVKVDIEFQRNGVAYPGANQEVRHHVERTLKATGVILPTPENSKIAIKVTMNNIADMDDAFAKGFGAGLTFGAAGTVVSDFYEIKIEYTDASGSVTAKNYKHALHTAIGNTDAPVENVKPTDPAIAVGVIVEQIMLNFVKDMQDAGMFTLRMAETDHTA